MDAARRVVAAEGAAERRAGRTSARAIQSARGSSREPSAGFPGSGATPARPPATRAALPRGSRLARPLADDPPPASRRDDEARSRSNARVRPASARAREAYFSAAAAAMRWPGEELDAFDAALDATRWRPPRATSARKPLGGRPSFALERVASVSDRIAPRLTNASTSTSMAPRSALERLPDDALATILARLDWRSLAAAEESSPEIRRVVVERRAWGACVARSVAVARAATAGGAFGDAAGAEPGTPVRRFAADRASVRVSALLKQFARKLAREPRPRARGSRSFPPNLAVEALCASSTDRDPEESVDRVLAPRSRGGSRKPPSYWSSAGSTTRDATDHVVLRLNAPLAVVHAVWIAPFRARISSAGNRRSRPRGFACTWDSPPITAPTAPTTATAADARDLDDPAAPSRAGSPRVDIATHPAPPRTTGERANPSGRGYGRRPSSRWRPPRRRNGSRSRRPRCASGESSPSNSRVDTRDRRRTGYGTSPSRTFAWRECRCPGTCPRR